MRLTELQIQKLPVPEKGQKTYWEGGFGVRVSQGGSKTFVVMYGKERRLRSLGRYPAKSLKTARTEAQLLLATKVPSRATFTLSEARMAFLEDCESRLRPGTVQNYRILLNRLTAEKLEEVKKADIGTDAHGIMAGKVFFNWCIKNDLTERNPFMGMRVSYNSRSRVLTHEEIKAVWQYDDAPFSDHLKLLILTGQRRNQFSQYEVRGDTLWFPAGIMKGKREHTIPLLPEAKAIVERLQPFNGWSKSKKRMDKHVKLPAWVIHDLRRTFSTMHAQIGTPIHVIEKILDHRSGTISGVAAIYNRHSYLEEARLWMGRFEKHLMGVVLSEA